MVLGMDDEERGVLDSAFAALSEYRLSSSVDSLTAAVGPNKAALESAMRWRMRELVRALQGSQDGGLSSLDTVETLINDAAAFASAAVVSASVPAVLLGDAFDALPLAVCAQLFHFLEKSSREELWQKLFDVRVVQTEMLLHCNGLLRRLSKTQDTVFAGRILMFLTNVFPLSDLTGVNRMGHFNVSNVTEYSDDATEGAAASNAGGSDSNATEQLDAAFHGQFWALQRWFNNPRLCYTASEWSSMADHVATVLDAFTTHRLEDQQQQQQQPITDELASSDDTLVCRYPKYLTSRKLLRLELGDAHTRRAVLVQLLIVCHYLVLPCKFKKPKDTLSDDQAKWVKATKERSFKLLSETPPDGQRFARSVRNTLERESSWVGWKDEGCPSFERGTKDAGGSAAGSSSSGGGGGGARKRKREEDGGSGGGMGTEALTRLWRNKCDGGESGMRLWLKNDTQNGVPSLKAYFEEAAIQLDPEQQVEEEYRFVNDATFRWRALRLIARRKLSFFEGPTFSMDNAILKIAQEWTEEEEGEGEGAKKEVEAKAE